MSVGDGGLHYTWSYKGQPHAGSLRWGDQLEFQDSWHQKEPARCEEVPGTWSLLHVGYRYMGDWGWRINLSFREPSGELVLQMTNITSWGEEARAVRMVCARVEPA